MHPEEIKKKDRDFIRILPKLRSKLAGRQKENAQKVEKKGRGSRRPLFWIAIPLLTAAIGLAVIYTIHDDGKNASRSKPVSRGMQQAGQRQTAPDPSHRGNEPLGSNRTVSPPGKASLIAPENLSTGDERAHNAELIASAGHKVADEKNIERISAVVCKGVQKHQPFGEQDYFDIADSMRVYVWMDVRSKKQPFVIKHVYYLNGRKQFEVPLNISYARMRTWSYVSLKEANRKGTWKVDIVCNGRTIKTVGFSVNGR